VIFICENASLTSGNISETFSKACKNGFYDVVHYMIEKKIGVEPQRYYLSYAVDGGNYSLVKYLHKNGFVIDQGESELAIDACRQGHKKILKYLLKSGQLITNKCYTSAVSRGYTNILKFLIKNYGQPTSAYPLILAKKNNNKKAITLLSVGHSN